MSDTNENGTGDGSLKDDPVSNGSGTNGATPQKVEGDYGTDQMRYIAGPDAEQIIAARKAMDDPEYLALVRSNMGL